MLLFYVSSLGIRCLGVLDAYLCFGGCVGFDFSVCASLMTRLPVVVIVVFSFVVDVVMDVMIVLVGGVVVLFVIGVIVVLGVVGIVRVIVLVLLQ